MTGELELKFPIGSGGKIFPIVLKGRYNDVSTSPEYIWRLGISTVGANFYIQYNNQNVISIGASVGIMPVGGGQLSLGYKKIPWANTFTQKLNNGSDVGEDIIVPTKGGTLALVSDIEDILRQHGLIQ